MLVGLILSSLFLLFKFPCPPLLGDVSSIGDAEHLSTFGCDFSFLLLCLDECMFV